MNRLTRWLPLLILICVLGSFFYFHLYRYFNFEALHQHRQVLLSWTQDHYLLTLSLFMLMYIVVVSAAIPAGIFFSLTGGFLFGTWAGGLYSTICTTLGGAILFITVKTAMKDWFARRFKKLAHKMEKGFAQNAFNYLVSLRFFPFFPFWFINVIAALLNVRLMTFMSATFLGVVPSILIYTSIGNSLGVIFDRNEVPNANMILRQHVLLPLIGLALLSVLPLVYKRFKKQ